MKAAESAIEASIESLNISPFFLKKPQASAAATSQITGKEINNLGRLGFSTAEIQTAARNRILQNYDPIVVNSSQTIF